MSWYPSSYPNKAATRAATKHADETAEFSILGSLRRAALAEGCTKIRLFSQAVGPVKAALVKQGSGGGVCRELAVWWLGAKKSGDDDKFLEAFLGLGGTVKEAELKKVVEAFEAMGEKNIVEQRTYTQMQLKRYFQIVSESEVLRSPSRLEQGPRMSAADWLFSPATQCNYRFFGIRGGLINHATAICLVPGKESFFDPNLGEFEFTHKRDEMQNFLNKHIFPEGGKGRGQYIGRNNKIFYDIERICCS